MRVVRDDDVEGGRGDEGEGEGAEEREERRQEGENADAGGCGCVEGERFGRRRGCERVVRGAVGAGLDVDSDAAHGARQELTRCVGNEENEEDEAESPSVRVLPARQGDQD